VNHASAECTIRNELGLHLRAAASFVKLAETSKSDVTLECDGVCANGKSIIALVTLAASKGTGVRVQAEGPDAQETVDALVALIEDRFGEES